MPSNGGGFYAREPQYAFVLGTGRCGSTLVHEVLARHPDVGFLSNVEDVLPGLRMPGRLNDILFRGARPALSARRRLRYGPSEGYRVLDRNVSPIISRSFRDLTAADATPWLTERVRRFFDSRAQTQGRRLFLHKFTGWPRARFLHHVFPEARFVHVMRDGRAVANSGLQMPWFDYGGPTSWRWGPLPVEYADEWEQSNRSYVVLAGIAWKMLMDAFDETRQSIPDDLWVEVRYEDLVSDPRSSFTELLRFLGLEWNGPFDARFDSYQFSSARREAWRQDLPPGDVALLDRSLSEHLRRHGYS
jgi:hypothetical protein